MELFQGKRVMLEELGGVNDEDNYAEIYVDATLCLLVNFFLENT